MISPDAPGAIPGALRGKRCVLTGIFPELGGGSGLTIGKDNAKRMVESFGGIVTGSISGKTDILVVGRNPGLSKVSKAKAMENLQILSMDDLRKSLLAPAPAPEAAPAPTSSMFAEYARVASPEEVDPRPSAARHPSKDSALALLSRAPLRARNREAAPAPPPAAKRARTGGSPAAKSSSQSPLEPPPAAGGAGAIPPATRQRAMEAVAAAEVPADVALSGEQALVLGLILAGESVFFTGAAGTGKSLILRVLSDVIHRQRRSEEVFFTAPTGIAAVNVGGVTVHSFSGVGTGAGRVEDMVKQAKGSRDTVAKWRRCQMLVIDEISMLSAQLFDKIAVLGSKMGAAGRDLGPFGGAQLVLCGDFFQLPPVGLNRGERFAFEAVYWKQVVRHNIVLRRVFRQRDSAYRAMLRELRLGVVSKETVLLLQRRVRLTKAERLQREFRRRSRAEGAGAQEIIPTKLYARNRNVDAINSEHLQQLEGEVFRYEARDYGSPSQIRFMNQNCPAQQVLDLRVGAQVMLLKNVAVARGLVNGARGVVVGFKHPPPEDEGAFFDGRMAGAALHPGRPVPIVRFAVLQRSQPAEVTMRVMPDRWEVQGGGRAVAIRDQLPLRLAWALSIHKSQGMSIDHLEVTLAGTFEYGQAYVALSRGTSLEGLRLNDFDPRHIRAHPRVAAFYDSLSACEEDAGKDGEGAADATAA